MNILAAFKALKEQVSALVADQSKATLASITEISTKLTNLETGALAQLEIAQASVNDLTAKLSDATAQLGTSNQELNSIKAALGTAVGFLKLEVKPEASTLEMISAMQGAVSGTLAKLGVQPGTIPAPKPTDTNGQGAAGKTMSLADFNKLSPGQKMAFTKEVNAGAAKLVD